MSAGLDFEQCYRAMASRDARLDGMFFIGVHTTGIYCRPSCPSPVTPKRRNVSFHRTAAAAQLAGLRACKRCRPDAAPGSPEWDARADLVGRAMRLIADGVVDRGGVAALAKALAVSERQLHRVLVEAVGAPPIALARAQRATTARTLLETTALPMTEVAFAAGFGSVRQFNDTLRQVYASSPTELRAARRRGDQVEAARQSLRLPVREPYDGSRTLDWLSARSIPGIEEVRDGVYRRSLRLPAGTGTVALEPASDHVRATFRLDSLVDLAPAVHRCRRLLDLDADPVTFEGALASDGSLTRLIAARPGLRVPGSVDPEETAMRAVLGQQVSVAAAVTTAARLVSTLGAALPAPDGGITHVFPTAEAIAESELAAVGVPRARRAALRELARRLARRELVLDGGADREEVGARLRAIRGVGDWTAAYVLLRGLGDPDAFPVSDLGLLRAARALGIADDSRSLAARSQRWRPWRSYAAQHLWEAPT